MLSFQIALLTNKVADLEQRLAASEKREAKLTEAEEGDEEDQEGDRGRRRRRC